MKNILSNIDNFNINTLSIEKLKYKDLWWFFYDQDLENDNNYALRYLEQEKSFLLFDNSGLFEVKFNEEDFDNKITEELLLNKVLKELAILEKDFIINEIFQEAD